MIQSIRHRGLRRFYETGNARELTANHVPRIRRILTLLDAATCPEDIEAAQMPGMRLHQLTGNRRGEWSMAVSGNWRITFRFEGVNVTDVTLEDYH